MVGGLLACGLALNGCSDDSSSSNPIDAAHTGDLGAPDYVAWPDVSPTVTGAEIQVDKDGLVKTLTSVIGKHGVSLTVPAGLRIALLEEGKPPTSGPKPTIPTGAYWSQVT
jgi:hypothetical protein